ncbi:hypothetical protein Acj9p022 [Acinetobacter phage Acj9]|uniref:Uncharacterized protein n=1 Tax=Acinetobacter phage Acj9 TaxID=760939 RepID=E5EPF6_9CAUD|nr:hypothetical protein Acj9p022 [Acinetobacter phage Acj9]ADG59922.1 hypothetical protein Acj9p022 [Acinetobacter phage Acj9]
MYQITFTSLERLVKYVEGVKRPLLAKNQVSSVEHASLTKRLKAQLTEAKALYALTLRYPLIAVSQPDIKWIIKNILPSQQELDDFYKMLGEK